ncbi:MAG TPA: Npt1/Npt2 family nucleotide transporter, partial [Candidatus Aminicenantes bacterium]|nr:Npt1/Npt2 family nucleotide transporter [Candidatus Aminicenantes bacterium]HPL14909.1 Npt1/Npt2 family nucleotide transporter [Candidatus Aminicenantes bacterium]
WNTKKIRALDRRAYIAWSQLFFAVGTVAFWLLFGLGGRLVPALYWFWFELFVLASVSQFWVVVGSICEPRRAKQLVGFFVGGGLAGGIAGSVLVVLLSSRLPARHLILLGLVFYLIAMTFIRAALRSAPGREEELGAGPVNYSDGFRTLAASPYLRLLSGLIIVALAASTMIDFQFNWAVKNAFPLEARRTDFLAAFSVGVLVVSWILNSVFAHRAIQALGVRAALFVTPLILALGSAAVFIIPAAGITAWAVLVKGSDKALTHTFFQATKQLLYLPLPEEVKVKAKMTIDIFVSKCGEALASLLQVVFAVILAFDAARMSFVTIGIIGLWLVILVRIGRNYLPAIRANLVPSRPDAERLVREQARADTAKRLVDLLESRERSSVLYAYNLFDLLKAERMTPELRQILSEKSAAVRASALDTLLDLDSEMLGPEWAEGEDPAALDVIVREVLALDSYQDVMRRPFGEVAASASPAREVDQMELAKVLGLMPAGAPLTDYLPRLLKHESPGVVHYALESAARLKKRDWLPLIVPHLGHPAVRDRAAETLEAYGDRAVPDLRDWMADFRADLHVRRSVPGVLASIGTSRAAEALVRQLRRRDPDVAEAVIEALFKFRDRRAGHRFRERDIKPEILHFVREACRAAAAGTSGKDEGEIRASPAAGYRQIFLLLGLLYPPEDVGRALQNYAEGTKWAVDYALELLEAVLPKKMKDAVLPVLEDAPADVKARSARRILKTLG